MKYLAIILMTLVLALTVSAEDVALDNPEQEARAQALMRELRCVACENEPISQSAAPIAEDMRARVRVMIADGASDTQVRDWFEDRYGEFVLFRPKAEGAAGRLLWGAPFLLLVFGGLIGWQVQRKRAGNDTRVEPVAPEDV